jgi:hypothetical protein
MMRYRPENPGVGSLGIVGSEGNSSGGTCPVSLNPNVEEGESSLQSRGASGSADREAEGGSHDLAVEGLDCHATAVHRRNNDSGPGYETVSRTPGGGTNENLMGCESWLRCPDSGRGNRAAGLSTPGCPGPAAWGSQSALG